VATGSFARGALVALTEEELIRMLELDESLFVEHKRDLGTETHYQLAKAVSSFANTLGGWLLIGVSDGKPVASQSVWASSGAPTLVDMVRDRLRGEVDPMPAFEAKAMRPAGMEGPVGVVRIYESVDTPHIVVSSGAVFVREVAGDTDVRKRGRQKYEAAEIKSRAQLLELAQRGEQAAARVHALMDYRHRPASFVEGALGLTFELVGEHHWQPRGRQDAGSVFVRAAPYTGGSRFRGWATTAEAAGAAIGASEALSGVRGLGKDFAKPSIGGVTVSVPSADGTYHADTGGKPLGADAQTAIESSGVVGAALHLETTTEGLRPRMGTCTLADHIVVPALEAALGMLEQGGFLGRVLCCVDFVGLGGAIGLEDASSAAAFHVSAGCEVSLPRDPDEVNTAAHSTTTALGRSADLPTWDPPASPH
jgi:hypothetical protein